MISFQLARLVEWAVFWEKPYLIVVDLGEKIAEYQWTIFLNLIGNIIIACIIILKFKERDSYVELWQNACSELEKLQEIERVCYVFWMVDDTSLNLVFL